MHILDCGTMLLVSVTSSSVMVGVEWSEDLIHSHFETQPLWTMKCVQVMVREVIVRVTDEYLCVRERLLGH